MHKIVEELIKGELGEYAIVSQHYDPNDLLEKNLFALAELSATQVGFAFKVELYPFEDFDSALLQGHKDINLVILYMSTYMHICSAFGKNERISFIYQSGLTIDIKQCHPYIQAKYNLSICTYLDSIGHQSESENICRGILKNVSFETSYAHLLIGAIAGRLSLKGKLAEIRDEQMDFVRSRSMNVRILAFTSYLISNHIITANLEKIQLLWSEFKNLFYTANKNVFSYCEDLTRTLRLDFRFELYTSTYLKQIAMTYHELLKGNLDLAHEAHQKSFQHSENSEISHSLHKYIPLHLSLNSKKLGLTRLTILELEKDDDSDYMLDFFRMRLSLLENEKETALLYYQRLMANVHKYKALGRLNFEARFAHELKVHDVLWLSGVALNTTSLPKQKIQENLIEKKVDEKVVTTLLGTSEEMQELQYSITQYANLKDTVYIHGETGTGKELVARALHEASTQKNEPFLAINCGALSDALLESELFGHEVGSFTGAIKSRIGIFESAGKGTVLLDEFGEISPRMQVALLRVLENQEIRRIGSNQAKKIKCRILVSTNRNLLHAVNEKKFREDLYYRVNRFDIHLPPLREHKEDISILAHHYLNLEAEKGHEMLLSDNLINALSNYEWPGNVRELRNEIERCRIFNKGKKVIELKDFDFSRLSPLVNTQEGNTTMIAKQIMTNSALSEKERVQQILSDAKEKNQRQETLMQLFYDHQKLTRIQIVKILKISPSTASRDLEDLCNQGVIEKVTPTKSSRSYYFILKQR